MSATTTAAPKPKKQPTPESARQTVTTFISNTGQTNDLRLNLGSGRSVHHGHRHLHAVQRRDIYPYSVRFPTPAVKIYGDTGGSPGTTPLATMTNPDTFADNAVNTFTAPANTTLSASTTYWLVTSNSAATDGQGFRVGLTNKTWTPARQWDGASATRF